jgi:Plasmid pRiA4b ORF-3-like protein/Domain of unknown function (DUF1841)
VSPVSRGRKKKSRSGKGRARLSSVPTLEGFYRTLADGFRPLAGTRDPLEVEMFTSGLLGTLTGPDAVGHEPDADLLTGFVDYCRRSGTPQTVAALHALRAVATTDEVREAAGAAMRTLNRPAPPWAESIGDVEVVECWRMGDVYGDQIDVMCVFGYGEARHAVMTLVDFNHLGGWVKDVFPIDVPAEVLVEMRKAVAESGGIATISPIDPAEVRPLLEKAFRATEMTWDADVSEAFAEFRALALARTRALPNTAPDIAEPDEVTGYERERIVDEFLASDEAAALRPPDAARYCARLIVDYGCDHDESQPLRVSPAKIEIFMLGWLPRKVLLDSVDRTAMPAVVSAWTRWAAARADLPAAAVTEVVDTSQRVGEHFDEAYDDPANASPGRLMLQGIGTLDSVDDVQEVLERRHFAMPYFGTRIGDEDYSRLDPNDPDERRLLIEGEHPEYHAALTDPSFDGEIRGVNPRLHIAMHEIVANQLWDDDPPEAWAAAQRLVAQGHDRHDVLHALADVAVRQLHGALSSGQPVADSAYRRALDALGGGRRRGTRAAKSRPSAPGAAATYQVKIGIRGAKPPIWRRLRLPADTTLASLHHVIQAAFGWEDCHLHHFFDDEGRRYTPADYESWDDSPADEAATRLRDVVRQTGDKLRYEYDFGDSWEHVIAVEDVLQETSTAATCLTGRRAGPIEDSGGVWGYGYLCEVMGDPDHPEHAEKSRWLFDVVGLRHFDPAAFDKNAVNATLATLRVAGVRG